MHDDKYVRNPFNDQSVSDPLRMCGRTRTIQSILEVLADREPRVVNLVGPRKIGKSIILRFLSHPDGALSQPAFQEAIAFPGQILMLYVDLADGYSTENPFAALADKLYDAIRQQTRVDLNQIGPEILLGKRMEDLDRTQTEQRMVQLADAAAREGIRIIIHIDHLDQTNLLENAVMVNQNIRPLARLAQSISMSIATRRTLVDLSSKVASSPVVHKLVVKRIGLLDTDEALDLLSYESLTSTSRFSEHDKVLLIEHVGTHPYLLIMAARQAYDYLLSGLSRSHLTINYVRFEIALALAPMFELLWSQSADELRAFLDQYDEKVLGLEEAAQDDVLQHLQKEVLVYENPELPGQYLFFSNLFRAFVVHKLSQEDDRTQAQLSPAVEHSRILQRLGLDTGTKEGTLLALLIRNEGQAVPDEEILTTIWESEEDRHALETTIGRLRRKLERQGGRPPGRIGRDRGRGYYFEYASADDTESYALTIGEHN